ncbi:hypothetical protein MMC07_000117 [Pseudocyphellaria aurata]|nr:hypothetical protein [Pseudocyphellaria aurata]
MSFQKPKVLLLGEIEHSPAQDAYESLSSLATLVQPSATNRDDFLEECRSGALDGVKVIYRTFNSVGVTGKIDGEVVGALGKEGLQVGYLCHNGAGYDQIDVAACTSAGIHVSNVPTAVNAATADTAIFLLLGALRSFNAPLSALRQGSWRGNPPPPLGHDPEDKLLGIVGMGGIGRDLKRRAEALGMKVQYHNRKELDAKLAGGARYVGFEELLRTSDVISLNLPLNPATHHLISDAEFSKMKYGVVIINTARGAVIDEVALVAAIDSGKVFSCGLDVYEDEPEVHPGLVGNEKVMLLPHMGTWTVETQTKMELWNISNVRAALETGQLRSPVPEQAHMS